MLTSQFSSCVHAWFNKLATDQMKYKFFFNLGILLRKPNKYLKTDHCATCLKDFWGVSGSGRYGLYLLTLTELHLANILKHANLEELEKDLNSFLFVDLGRMVPVQDNVDSFQVKMNILSKYYLFMPKVLSMMQNMV